MEELIKASKAYEMTENGIEKKCDEVIRIINDAILEATKIGDYAAHILFDPLPAHVLDRIYDALIAAGYDICGLSDEDIYISWADAEADEPPTKPTAADVDTNTTADTNVVDEDLDDYEREYVVKGDYLRDLISDAIRYATLACNGVDNWEGYDDALADACKIWKAENMDDVTSKYWEHCVNIGVIKV